MRTLFTGTGKAIEIGQELGKGGEASIYEVSVNHLVAKLYNAQRQPNKSKQDKLRFMVKIANQQLLSYAAWPQETLHKVANGPVIGFLMPKISAHVPIHFIYGPARRRQDYPQAAWDFLLSVSRNTAAAFATIHQCGYVVGDVNQDNLLVGADSKVVLIDTDSFQINANGTMHLCEVGVAYFTPPELQGSTPFNRIVRTSNHDNFGLALLIFHLLFGGRHPYAGVPLRNDAGEALEKDIQAFRYAYASDGQLRGFSPPPRSIPINLVPDHIQSMFTLAFTEKGSNGNRPTAQQWVTALDGLRAQLKRCSTNSMHVYPDHLKRCPWCALEDHGVIYFVNTRVTNTQVGNSGFVLVRVWAVIEAVTPPPAITIPNISNISVTPTPLPADLTKDKTVIFWRIVTVSITLWLLAAIPEVWFLTLCAFLWAWIAAGRLEGNKRKTERIKREAALDIAQQAYDQIIIKIGENDAQEAFRKKKHELMLFRDEYQQLSEREKTEIANLHATAQARQKHQFLERQFLDIAVISGVGPAKKAALRSFGIETAADVTWNKVIAVKGFGEVLTRAVVDWRKACERRFVFNPNVAVTEADKNAVRAKIMTRKRALETSLNAGPAELQRLSQETIMRANKWNPVLLAASQKLAQAQADLNVIS